MATWRVLRMKEPPLKTERMDERSTQANNSQQCFLSDIFEHHKVLMSGTRTILEDPKKENIKAM
jgi:hypothetical protein